MFGKKFWVSSIERAVKTFAQSAASLMTADGAGLLDLNWTNVWSIAGLAALYSLLTSIGSAPLSVKAVHPTNPSLVEN